MTRQFKVGDHVIYRGDFRYPGEVVTIYKNDRVLVRAFGDASGNYTGMLMSFSHDKLDPYRFEDDQEAPPLVLFPTEPNVFGKIIRHSQRHGKAHQSAWLLTRMLNEIKP